MKLAALVLLAPMIASAQNSVFERAAIERDRQSAEFSRPELRDFHMRRDQQHLPPRPDERALEARERDAQPVPQRAAPLPRNDRPAFSPALPLPGGPGHGVDPIPVQGGGG